MLPVVSGFHQEEFDFLEWLDALNEELEILNSEARELEERIALTIFPLQTPIDGFKTDSLVTSR
jgi:hypothetical protein